MNTILQTPRILIREFSPDEEELLVDLYRDEEVIKHVSKRTEEETRQKFRAAIKGYENNTGLGRWGVFNPTDSDFIGVCILMPNETDQVQIELGYVFRAKYWGRGLATELAKSLVYYGFNNKGLTEICACTDPENKASQNVLMKAGLVRDGNVYWHKRELPFFRIRK